MSWTALKLVNVRQAARTLVAAVRMVRVVVLAALAVACPARTKPCPMGANAVAGVLGYVLAARARCWVTRNRRGDIALCVQL